jgi:hypothetical protein
MDRSLLTRLAAAAPSAAAGAFGGLEARKREAMDRVAGLWQRGLLAPGNRLHWQDGGGKGSSLSGALICSKDVAAFEGLAGFGLANGQLAETLLALGAQRRPEGMALSPMLAGFYLEWLQALRPGADLARLVPEFMHSLLLDLLAEGDALGQRMGTEQRALTARLAALWAASLQGEALAAAEWRSLRKAAVDMADTLADPWAAALAEVVAALAWAPLAVADECPGIAHKLLGLRLRQLATAGMDAAERAVVAWAVDQPRRQLRASAMPGYDLMAWYAQEQALERAGRDDAQEAAHLERQQALRSRAQPLVDALLRRLMDRYLALSQAL